MEKNQLINNLKDESGFSIASIAVAMAVLSIVSVGITSMLQKSMSTVGYIEDKQSSIDLKNEITIDFSDSRACRNTLMGLSVSRAEQPVTQLKNRNDTPLFTSNKYDMITIENISLHQVPANNILANSTGRMDLVIDLSRERTVSQQSLKSIKIPLNVTSDGSRRVLDCVALGSGELGSEARKCQNSGSGDRTPSVFGNGSGPSPCREGEPCTKYEEGSVYQWRTGAGSGGDGSGSGHDYHKRVCINARWVEIL